MEQINVFISSILNITKEQIINIAIAILIAFIFKALSSNIACAIIKIFKLHGKEKIRRSTLYRPIRGLFTVIGIYLAIMFLREPLMISTKIINLTNIIFRISVIITIAKGFVEGLTIKSGLIIKLKNKLSNETEETSNKNSLEFMLKVVKGIIYIIAGILVIQELGYDLKGLIAGLGIGGVILTLAAQDTAKNLFGGLVIFLDKPFKVGDYIQLLTYEGIVENITFRSTSVRTLDDALLHIPNSEVSSATITNWSELNKRRYKTNIILTLETPLEKVEKAKSQIEKMLSQEEIIDSNTISVKFQNILDSGIEIVIIAYANITKYSDYLELKENLNYKIMKILEENKVELAYNTQTIYIKN